MLDIPLVAAIGAYCANHPNASNCTPNNIGAELIAIVIVTLIVLLVIFNWWWKRGNPASSGPIVRVFLAIVRRFAPRDR
jgi:hypothetical protein